MQPIYAVTPEGTAVRIRFEDLGVPGMQALTRAVAADACIPLPFAFKHAGEPVSIYYKDRKAYASVRLRKITLNTAFIMEGDHFVPSFAANQDSINLVAEWTPPEEVHVRIGIVVEPNSGEWLMRTDGSRLFATVTGVPGDWKLPLPNVYPDARVCLGLQENVSMPTIEDVFTRVLTTFQSARWNTDLISGVEEKAKLMFRIPIAGVVPDAEVPFAPVEGLTANPSRYLISVVNNTLSNMRPLPPPSR